MDISGEGSRLSGGEWQITGQTLPSNQTGYIKAVGNAYGGLNNSSASSIQSITYYYNKAAECGTANYSIATATPTTDLCKFGTASAVSSGASQYTWICTNGSNTQNCLAYKAYTVTASAGANGSVSPTSKTIKHGNTTEFSITADSGYVPQVSASGCSGTVQFVSGNNYTYTTQPITADCSISITFATGQNGECGVAHNTPALSTPTTNLCAVGSASAVTENSTQYTWTCSGIGGGLTASCSAPKAYAVTTSVTPAGGGTISPSGVVAVAMNTTKEFTLTPSSGYVINTVTGTCGGTLTGSIFTTNTITGNCTVVASFSLFDLTVFDPDANAPVHAIGIQPDGKVVLGGEFTLVKSASRSKIARLNVDGTLDTAFSVNVNGTVRAIAFQSDGKIIIGGDFTTIGSDSRGYLARLNTDGTLDASFTTVTNAPVYAILVDASNNIYVGGQFTTIAGQSRNYLAKLNSSGTLDTGFLQTNGAVYAFSLDSIGRLVIGGDFTQVGSETIKKLARIKTDGTLDTAINAEIDSGTVYAVAVRVDNGILFGGSFSTVKGSTRNNIALLNFNGTLASYNPNANGTVRTLLIQPDGNLLVGGDFTNIGGQSRNRIARLNFSGTADSLNQTANDTVRAIALLKDGVSIIVGGSFTTVGGETRNRVARINPDGTLDKLFNPSPNAIINASSIQADGRILVGGQFDSIGGLSKTNLARLNSDGIVDTTFTMNADYPVYAILIQPDGKIIIGGGFNNIGGQAKKRLVRLNSDFTFDSSFVADMTTSGDGVKALALQADGMILVGGSFDTVNGQTRNHFVRLNSDGSLDTTFDDPAASAAINNVVMQSDGRVLVSGSFTQILMQSRQTFARLTHRMSAIQTLSVDSTSTITWLRSEASPEIDNVSFWRSTDMTTWTNLGNATRISGGWQLTGLSLTQGQIGYIRAQGISKSTGSTALITSVKQYYFASTDNAVCGSANGVTTSTTPTTNLCSVGVASDVTSGNTQYTWTCYVPGTGSDASCSAPRVYVVTPSAGANGSISPNTAQTVQYNDTVSFTVTPNSGYVASVSGTCGGSLSGNTYTTNPITANCTVDAVFASGHVNGVCGSANGGTFTTAPSTNLCSAGTPTAVSGSGPWTWQCLGINGGSNSPTCSANIQSYTVTDTATGTGRGTVSSSPAGINYSYNAANTGSLTANHGSNVVLTATANTGSTVAWTTCSGTTAGNGTGVATCTFSSLDGTKTAQATFTINTYTVTPNPGAGGSMTPNTPQTVDHSQTTDFTITPNAGKVIDSVTGCNGSLSGNNYKTGPITANCTVTATFKYEPVVPTPEILVSATDLDYGKVTVGQTSSKPITIKNTGNANLVIGNITKTGDDFNITDDLCSAKTIAANQICTMKANFSPQNPTGNKNGQITIPSNAGANKTVNLTGEAVAEAKPKIEVFPTQIDFAKVNVAGNAQATVTVKNIGNAQLTITGVTITGADAGKFAHNNACGNIAAGQTCQFNVTYTPGSSGTHNAVLEIESNDPNIVKYTVPVKGTTNNPTDIIINTGGTEGFQYVIVKDTANVPDTQTTTTSTVTNFIPTKAVEFGISSVNTSVTITVTFDTLPASPVIFKQLAGGGH